jgi:hypothetical protein
MNLSANSLFHFTKDINSIKSILNDQFYGGYCKEVLFFKGQKLPLFIPMISFCDTRLETINRFTKYGRFGIGLNKDWGIKMKLNPVFYLEKNSLVADSLLNAFFATFLSVMTDSQQLKFLEQRAKFIQEELRRDKETKKRMLQQIQKSLTILKAKKGPLEHFIYSLYYTKHYEADLERENDITKDYRFYDEREWRYMPEFKCAVCQLRRTEEEYINGGEKVKRNLCFRK